MHFVIYVYIRPHSLHLQLEEAGHGKWSSHLDGLQGCNLQVRVTICVWWHTCGMSILLLCT